MDGQTPLKSAEASARPSDSNIGGSSAARARHVYLDQAPTLGFMDHKPD